MNDLLPELILQVVLASDYEDIEKLCTSSGKVRDICLAYKNTIKKHIRNEYTKTMNEIVNKGKKYYILDNGGTPMVVFILNNRAVIKKTFDIDIDNFDEFDNDNTDEFDGLCIEEEIFLTFKFKQYFIGEQDVSILLNINDKDYVIISGNSVIEFLSPEIITTYVGLYGNSDVIYPYAISNNFVYVLMDGYMKFATKTSISYKENDDVYLDYYYEEDIGKHFLKLDVKKIHYIIS
jgi:hypothetical protein